MVGLDTVSDLSLSPMLILHSPVLSEIFLEKYQCAQIAVGFSSWRNGRRFDLFPSNLKRGVDAKMTPERLWEDLAIDISLFDCLCGRVFGNMCNDQKCARYLGHPHQSFEIRSLCKINKNSH